ncbi:CLUMA_CG006684, isoform A [Clunio marinus]|uniref:CLUMA_CG006684, isoform A n=1 Tax=Clunio marinus TaxID=568069 RepID=A0A1J1HY63_9DIPT|nr:CLUMA_CG006684, isoform A [Clunio marinus]
MLFKFFLHVEKLSDKQLTFGLKHIGTNFATILSKSIEHVIWYSDKPGNYYQVVFPVAPGHLVRRDNIRRQVGAWNSTLQLAIVAAILVSPLMGPVKAIS